MVASLTGDSPEYSEAAMPRSADPVGVRVIFGVVPPPCRMGALQTLISVPSEAVKCESSMNASPAESVTLAAVALRLLQMPATTTSRLPMVRFEVGVTEMLVPDAVGGGLLHEGWGRAPRGRGDGVGGRGGRPGRRSGLLR